MAVSKIYSKGQVTLPKAVREAVGLSTGDAVIVEARDGEVVVKKARGVLEFVAPPRSGPEVAWPEARRLAQEEQALRVVERVHRDDVP